MTNDHPTNPQYRSQEERIEDLEAEVNELKQKVDILKRWRIKVRDKNGRKN